ncbi:MAG: hypothetical protein ACI4VP_04900 [Clostridia bacterium]
MNQILFTNNDNNNYNKTDTRKIIVVFCIAIILIAVAIIALKVFALNDDKQENGVIPEIVIARENEDTREVTIKANCEDGISYIIYTWNEEQENKVNLNGSTNFERIIDIPENSNNILKVEVVSAKGVKNEKTEEFKLDIDNQKPKIDSITIVDSKLQIKASDDNGIAYLKYQWEDEQEVIVNADEENNKEITVEIDIKRGTYKLIIKVFDISGNKEELSKLITGVNEPEIKVIRYGEIVRVTVTHDMGFKRIEYIINNDLYVYDENYSKYDKNKTTIELDFPIQEGENLVQVTAYSLETLSEDVEDEDNLENYSSKTFTGKCTYEIGE